jgi:nucleotide-binding universal stress UspA family protein
VGRNERVARLYLDRLKARVARHGIDVRALVLRGDVRSQLIQIVTKDDVDLVVLSSKGRSNRSDVPYGSVTSYLMTRVAAPILVVRASRSWRCSAAPWQASTLKPDFRAGPSRDPCGVGASA